VALPLGRVGAVGEEDGDERHDQQRQRARLVDDDDARGEREARVGDGDREVHQQHPAQRLEAQQALGDRDRAGDQQHGHERGDLGREQRVEPDRGAEPVGGGGKLVEDDHRQAGGERELRDVEDDLDGRQAAVDQQHHDRADEPRDDEVDRGREQQAEHERQVAERERVGAAAEVQVHDAALGGEEAQREAPPRQVHARVELGEMLDRPGEQRHGRDDDRDVERPHAAVGGQQAPRAIPWEHDGLIGGRSRWLKHSTAVRRVRRGAAGDSPRDPPAGRTDRRTRGSGARA
jgi:hypothetical protein